MKIRNGNLQIIQLPKQFEMRKIKSLALTFFVAATMISCDEKNSKTNAYPADISRQAVVSNANTCDCESMDRMKKDGEILYGICKYLVGKKITLSVQPCELSITREDSSVLNGKEV